jgi:hypothetical protein
MIHAQDATAPKDVAKAQLAPTPGLQLCIEDCSTRDVKSGYTTHLCEQTLALERTALAPAREDVLLPDAA